ncbi:hypothetical protein I6F26_24540 [Ensifer sp. IC3342]|nr:hypothetical protein [Ensifer sp. IC3342]
METYTATRHFADTVPKARLPETEEGFSFRAEDPSRHERDVYRANFNQPAAK